MNRKERRRQEKLKDTKINLHGELLKGIEHHKHKNFIEAEKTYLKIISHDDKNYETLRHLGILYHDIKEYNKGFYYLKKAVSLYPKITSAYNNVGVIHSSLLDWESARKAFQKSFELNNNYLPAVNNLAKAYFSLNEPKKCMEFALQANQLNPNDAIARLNIALAHSINGELELGIEKLELLKNDFKTDDVFNQLGLMYEIKGDLEKANEYLFESFKLSNENYGMLAKLIENKVVTEKDINFDIEERYKTQKDLPLLELSYLTRCIYALNNNKTNYVAAGDYLNKSNEYKDKYLNYDISNDKYLVESIISNFSSENLGLKQLNKSKEKISINPIFILGMPRSGTTLTEQILASHSKVHGGGELDYLVNALDIQGLFGLSHNQTDNFIKKILDFNQDQWDKVGAKYIEGLEKINFQKKVYVTDKMPHNFMMCGVIQKMLPNAKIIYCYRDAMDNCFSLYKNSFAKMGHAYSYDQVKLAGHFNLHLTLMDHWKKVLGDNILFLKNEDLIDNQKKVTSNILNHCGLEWEDQCMEFYNTNRDVRTLSLRQVRNPLNKNSLGMWKRYSDSLAILKENIVK